MSRSAYPPALHELLSHSTWIWQLARRLVRDDQAADDVVQDAWVAALEHPPRSQGPGSLRGWLATVTHNLALRRRSAEERRTRREHEVACPEEQPAADRVLEREEARRELVAMVLALDEPLRTPLLLRYFDELPPHEIARRLGLPGSTLRGRLQRGVEVLRSRMQERRGSQWKDWCLALVPSGGMAATGTTSGAAALTGVLAMAMQWKLAVLVVALVALSLTVWRPWNDGHVSPTTDLVASAAPSIDGDERGEGAPQDTGGAASVRVPIGGRVAPVAAPGEIGILVYGTVEMPGAEGEQSGSVVATSERGDRLVGEFDERGAYSIVGLGPGRWSLRTWSRGFRSATGMVDLESTDRTVRHDLKLERSVFVPVRFLTPEGEPHPLAVGGPLFDRRPQLVAAATRDRPGRRFPSTGGGPRFSFEQGHYVGRLDGRDQRDGAIPEGAHGLLEMRAEPPLWISAILGDVVLDSRPWRGTEQDLEFRIDATVLDELVSEVRVRIVDSVTGSPVEGLRVDLRGAGALSLFAVTDEQGVVLFPSVWSGEATLELSASTHESLRIPVDVPVHDLLDLGPIALAPAASIRGRVVDEEGRPVVLALSWAPLDLARQPRWLDHTRFTRSDAEGNFQLSGCGRRRLLLREAAHWEGRLSTAVVIDATRGDVEDVELVVRRGVPVTFDFPSVPAEPERWMLWRDDGIPLHSFAATPEPQLVWLDPGTYSLHLYQGGNRVHSQEIEVSEVGGRVEVAR